MSDSGDGVALTDSHAHLDFAEFTGEIDALLNRAAEVGVHRIVTIGTSIERSRNAVALARQHSNVWAAVGIHPTSAAEAAPDAMEQLRDLLREPRVAALGEIGIDHHWLPGAEARRKGEHITAERASELEQLDADEKAVQARVFSQQLQIAEEGGWSVVIHQRAAWEETLRLLRPYAGRLQAVYHCFGEPWERAREILDLGFHVSFTGIVTFKNALALQESASNVPDGRFMVETDCPYLAPIPHRGKRCEPAYARLVLERVAALRGKSVATVARSTEETANAFFRFR